MHLFLLPTIVYPIHFGPQNQVGLWPCVIVTLEIEIPKAFQRNPIRDICGVAHVHVWHSIGFLSCVLEVA
jgi:hypothetical protein